jgi:hypothetical protein
MISPAADTNAGPDTAAVPPLSDDELLAIVRGERARSIGFDLDPDLTEAREKALNYAKGEMPDIAALPNRSQAVSTDIADAVETILPDLVEIFTGGDDVVSFVPHNADDEVRHVVFDDNDGFMTFLAFFKHTLRKLEERSFAPAPARSTPRRAGA